MVNLPQIATQITGLPPLLARLIECDHFVSRTTFFVHVLLIFSSRYQYTQPRLVIDICVGTRSQTAQGGVIHGVFFAGVEEVVGLRVRREGRMD